jgi:hypothetical protein
VCGCLPSVRVSSLALVSKSALAKEKERAVNFGSSRKSAHSARESTFQRDFDLLRSRKENRSVENVPPESDIALGFSCCFVRAKFPPAQTDEPYKIEYSVLFFFERAQPRNARDLRVRALALRRCCAFSAAGATQLHAPRRSRAMSARTGWKRTADGRMMRSESAEDVMEEDEPSMLLDRVPAHVLREVFGFLGDSDLARAEATCATFRQASRSESLWRDKLADKLGDQAKIVLPEKLPHERYARARRRLRRHRISLLLFSPPRSGRVAPRAR